MNTISRIIILFTLVIPASYLQASDNNHFSCKFDQSVLVDSSGAQQAKIWESKGFTISGDWLKLDSGNLKLKITKNIQKAGIIILRGGEFNKGYQFSLENEKFVYVMLMTPTAQTWTVTGTCKRDFHAASTTNRLDKTYEVPPSDRTSSSVPYISDEAMKQCVILYNEAKWLGEKIDNIQVNQYSEASVNSYNRLVSKHSSMTDSFNKNCSGKQSESAYRAARELNQPGS